MKAAGMAVGTFYNYYASKDQLFMEIFNEENAALKRRILDALDLNADPMEVMGEMIMRNMEGMMADPILKQWHNRTPSENRAVLARGKRAGACRLSL